MDRKDAAPAGNDVIEARRAERLAGRSAAEREAEGALAGGRGRTGSGGGAAADARAGAGSEPGAGTLPASTVERGEPEGRGTGPADIRRDEGPREPPDTAGPSLDADTGRRPGGPGSR